MKLPVKFVEKMYGMLGQEQGQALIDSYKQPKCSGLRVNTLKVDIEKFIEMSPFELEPVPWTKDGFYYPEGEAPGKHPYYHAGLYYIQEPSAMLPGAVLQAKPGEMILDLCSAPGGKAVQIAAAMENKGLLVLNDINSDRVKALIKNLELCGVKNAIVLNESPERLTSVFQGFFDRVLTDVPCSGEGMFRKDPDAARNWETYKCERCAEMQQPILESAHEMLKPGGILVYSTCTFSPEEDEISISNFLEAHSDYEVINIEKVAGMLDGRPEWGSGREDLRGTARIWPHLARGEGHFAAKLKKFGLQQVDDLQRQEKTAKESVIQFDELPSSFHSFLKDAFYVQAAEELFNGVFMMKGKNLYMLPECPPSLNGIKTAKFGWYLGEVENERFTASHSMAVALPKDIFTRTVDLEADSREVSSYLKGETLLLEGAKGYTAVCVDGYTLGWAKQTGDILKNLYPKGWRKMN